MRTAKVIVVGAGAGGLAAALDLSRAGIDVTVLDALSAPGGKMRQISVGGRLIDGGPTVFTMRWVFDQLFADAGTSTDTELRLTSMAALARHAWSETERLDLFADLDQSVDAIGVFAGVEAARGYRAFCERAALAFDMLDESYIRAERPTVSGMMMTTGVGRAGDVMRVKPYTTLWRALHEHFRDPRLRQLFGRYATYSGSSPFLASATLMLIAHVERLGVWRVDGGMHALPRAIERVAAQHGARFRYGAKVASIGIDGGRVRSVTLADGDRLEADAVVFNGDANAIATGLLGRPAAAAVAPTARADRSQSAITFAMTGQPTGFELLHHNVFFSNDYAAEFDDVFARSKVPRSPTVYICAQDRPGFVSASGSASQLPGHPSSNGLETLGVERLLCLINAPAHGDTVPYTPQDLATCQSRMFQQLERCGLNVTVTPDAISATTPPDFEALFPATGGALYGQASHGWMAPFQRPSARTRVPGLYLCGGSTHPGAGVPMATLSGRNAARNLLADLASTSPSRMVAMPGGISTR
ncbi:MAG: phytoene desaturase [Hyphomicrobiaceae bacterium]|nr:phytoene desaturase [Hyphomicrobiaceae bacterium]